MYGGATVCAWYPITPSSSVAEAFQKYCGRYRVDQATGRNKFAIVQAEDELASIGMVIGAGWNGARAFTATSGPGVSLMAEFIGLAYFAEIPATIINVQRGGPSTGMPTRTQQSDLLACAYASHGDTKHVLLFPEDPHECFEFTAAALDLAERLQTPIFVMTDLDIGMNHRLCAPLAWDDSRRYDRGKVMSATDLDAGKDFGRYLDVDGDGIPFRTLPGAHPTRGAYFTRGTTKDAHARYSEAGSDYMYNMERLLKKFDTAKRLVPQPIVRRASHKTAHGVIYFGSTSPSMNEALGVLEQSGVHLDRLRIRAFPFPDSVKAFIEQHEQVFVVEQNRDAQLRSMLVNELQVDPARLVPILHYDGTPITARFIVQAISDRMPGAQRATAAGRQGRVRKRHDLPREAEAPPSHAAREPARLHAARLRGQDLDAVRGLRPRLDLGRDHPGLLGTRHRAAPRGQAVRHRLLVEDAGLLPRQLARLQLGARPHAVGADRREPRQPRPALPRRVGRRRLGLDRPRPVRAPDPARRQHDLHRREQRRVRPDQGPVLGHRRPGLEVQARRDQPRRADRHGVAGAAARRHLRGARLLGRQGAAGAADQGRAESPRRRAAST